MRTEKEIRADIRETRREMRASGVRRSSFMNGGHSPESYRLNARMFALETELQNAQAPTVEYASSETAYGRTVNYGFAIKVF